jgi:hypothetical protein
MVSAGLGRSYSSICYPSFFCRGLFLASRSRCAVLPASGSRTRRLRMFFRDLSQAARVV